MKKEPGEHKTTTRLRQESRRKNLTLTDDTEKRERESKTTGGAVTNDTNKTIRCSEARRRHRRNRLRQPEEGISNINPAKHNQKESIYPGRWKEDTNN